MMSDRAAPLQRPLDGWWTFIPLAEPQSRDVTPPTEMPSGAGRIRVPGYWNHFPPELGGNWGAYDHYRYLPDWQQAVAGWYRTAFPATPPTAGDRAILRFDAVAGHASVWLNGQRLGENFDSFLPFEFDVSARLRNDAENELWVLVQPPPQRDGRWLQPPGSWVGWHLRGIWQSVRVRYTPPGAIEDIFAQPSVRNDRLCVDVTVSNTDGISRDVTLAVHDGERAVREFDRQRVVDGGSTIVRFTCDRPGLAYWSPESPKLYTLSALLHEDGHPVHERSVPLGFREFWVDGTAFRLNGDPIRLLGDSWHYMGVCQQNPAYARTWFDFARATGAHAIRTHAMPYPPCYFDLADEMGLLIVAETAIYGSAGTLGYDADEFWQRCRDHVRRMVLRDRHHPSIVMWSATNETVWAAGERIFPELASLRKQALAVDPTRVVSYDENDSNIGGASPVHGGHYGTVAHWRDSWQRDRPLLMHEFGALYHGGPHDACPFGDDAVYADYLERLRATGEDSAEMFMGVRGLGAASITPWNLNWYALEPLPGAAEEVAPELTIGGPAFDRIGERALTLNYGFLPDQPRWRPNPAYAPLADCYRRQCCYAPHASRQGFAAADYACEVQVFNDITQPATLALVLRVSGAGDATSEPQVVELQPLENATLRPTVALPHVDRVTTCRATLTLARSDTDEVLHTVEWPIHVHPRGVHNDARRPVWYAGAPGKVRPDWQACAIDTIPATLLDDPGATLVLDDAELGGSLRQWLDRDAIRAWLGRGGRILALPAALADDDTSTLAPIRRRVSRVFARGGGILADLSADHLRDWPGPDGTVATVVMQRPETGPAVALLDAGHAAAGLVWSPLVGVTIGAGSVILCGMLLVERADDTPAAALLLQKLTHDELGMAAPWTPAALDGCDCLTSLADEVRIVRGAQSPRIFADGSDLATLERRELSPSAIEALLADGGTLVLHNVVPATATEWSQRLGVELRLVADKCYNVARATDDPLLVGINNYDLCWVDRDQKQPITRYTLDLPNEADATAIVQTVATRWEDYQMAPEQHKVAMMYRRLDRFAGPRAAVLVLRRGAGRVIINQLLLHEATGGFRGRARRILSRWADAIGCQRDASVNPLFVNQQRATTAQGFVVDWLVAGPFTAGQGHPLDHPFIDESDARPAAADDGWARRTAAFAEIDLSGFETPDAVDRVAYAVTYVHAARDRSVLLDAPDMVSLLAGADGGIKVFLNGAAVGRFDFVRELVRDNDRVDGLPLKRGWNTLVLKLHKRGGGRWAFAARLLTSAGEPVQDIDVQAERPAELGVA